MNFAVLTNNVVSNIIVADSLEIAEEVAGSKCIQYLESDNVAIGHTYDEINKVFIKNIDL